MDNPFQTAVKILAIVLLSPLWLPVLKTLYQDVEAALWREGGLFGREPTGERLRELEQKYAEYEDPLVSVPKQGRRRSGR
ncbi:hypothetical protein [Engelhardtia mirabilis]|uniref:Uncharacterized protein n=1 Tax=Engelhardtia mirabilis TaxID=2528011 RepID=A0A518BK08_9BACT|nr:hypothetical protein Pla133_23890 [Planctomycetes bacterium Pla133]QDV01635.1 hypothetical protein Pla86_23880 [Planctomycetes bacterium Pla86]